VHRTDAGRPCPQATHRRARCGALPITVGVMDEPDDAFTVPVRLRRELLRQGWNDRAIAHQLRSGQWVRPRRGAYCDAEVWKSLDTASRHVVTTRAVMKQAETDSIASHASAVPVWGGPTWGLDLSSVHTTRKDGKTGRHEAGVHQHSGVVLDADVATRNGLDVMTPTRAAIEVSTVAPGEVALAVLNDFLHRELTTPEEVRHRYDAGMDHWPDSRVTEIVIRLGDPRLASVLETRFFWFCYEAGLPAPEPQYKVWTPHRHLVAELDFAWPDLGAYVETHGKSKYLELLRPGQRPGDVIARDRRREELVGQLTGFRALHVGWNDLDSPRMLEQRVRNHLWPARRSAV
jgi:hypothetical protein